MCAEAGDSQGCRRGIVFREETGVELQVEEDLGVGRGCRAGARGHQTLVSRAWRGGFVTAQAPAWRSRPPPT